VINVDRNKIIPLDPIVYESYCLCEFNYVRFYSLKPTKTSDGKNELEILKKILNRHLVNLLIDTYIHQTILHVITSLYHACKVIKYI
jgi:hypothetical protein